MNTKELKSSIKLLSSFANKQYKKNPCYNNIYFFGNKIYASVNNSNSSNFSVLSYNIDFYTENSFCVNSKNLLSLIKAVKSENITFRLENKTLIINEFVRINVDFINPKFIDFYCPEETKKIKVNHDFCTQLKNLAPLCSNDDLRPVLSGVLFDGSDGCNIVASDGHVLGVKKISSENYDISFIIPQYIAPFFPECEEFEYFKKSDTDYIKVCSNGLELLFSCIDGRYPNWRSVIPDKSKNNVVFDRKQLKDFLDVSKSLKYLMAVFYFSGSFIKSISGPLCSGENNYFSSIMETDKECNNNESIYFSLNIDYLQKIFKIIDSNKMDCYFNGFNTAVLFKNIDSIFLIMPLPPYDEIIEECKKISLPDNVYNGLSVPIHGSDNQDTEQNGTTAPGSLSYNLSVPIQASHNQDTEQNSITAPGPLSNGLSVPIQASHNQDTEQSGTTSPGYLSNGLSVPIQASHNQDTEQNSITAPGSLSYNLSVPIQGSHNQDTEQSGTTSPGYLSYGLSVPIQASHNQDTEQNGTTSAYGVSGTSLIFYDGFLQIDSYGISEISLIFLNNYSQIGFYGVSRTSLIFDKILSEIQFHDTG